MTPDLTSAAWAQARYEYEHTDKPVQDICREHGTTPNTLRDRVRRWGWTPRRLPIPAEGPPPTPMPQFDAAAPSVPDGPRIEPAAPCLPTLPDVAASQDASAPDGPTQIVPRLQGAVARVLPAIEATLAKLAATSTHPREMERAARALAALMRTLRELNALLGQHAVPDDEGPKTMDEFRQDLARKIDAIIAARPKRPGDGAPPEA